MGKSQRIFYGWRITWALAITETVSYGVLFYAFSVYILPLEEAFGWSRGQISGALSLALLISGILAVPVGFWLDKYGARLLMTVGSVGGALLFALFSQVKTISQLYLVWAGIGVTMAMLFYEPAFVVVARWFSQKRGRAMAVVTLVAGFASTIFLPLSDRLMRDFGRVSSILILAIILAVINIPLHALILRRDPSDLGLFPDGATDPEVSKKAETSISLQEAVGDHAFWWLSIGFALAVMSANGLRVHIVPLFIERGFSAEQSATAAGAIGAMQVVGRLFFAPVGDKISPKKIVLFLFALQIVALGILRFIPTNNAVWLFIILMGAVNGATTLARPLMVAAMYGTAQYGRISSTISVAQTIGITIAPFGAGVLYTQAGETYDTVLVICMILTGIGLLAIMRIRK